MKTHFTRLLYLALFWPFFSLALPAKTPPQTRLPSVALIHVTVIDATGAPAQPERCVLIRDGRIAAIGLSGKLPIPHGATVVDGSGKFLIPGLWDMHVHLNFEDYLPLFLANGVTGVRVMWGDPEHQQWRQKIESGQLLGPRMKIASAIVDGPVPYWHSSVSVATEAQARQAVDDAKQEGADFVKIYQFLPRDLFFDLADEAKKQGIPFAGHLPLAVTAEEASAAGQRSFEHLVGILPAVSTRSADLFAAQQSDLADGFAQHRHKFWGAHSGALRDAMLETYSPEKAAALAAVLRRNGTWQCPTLILLHMFAYGDDPAFLKDDRLRYMPPRMKEDWDPSRVDGRRTPEDFAYMKREFDRDLAVVGALQRGGEGILAGTDAQNPYSFYGFSLHDELGFLVQAGLTPMQALQAATSNPARFFGQEKEIGTVETGKIADLVLLDANPLESIANTTKIAAVVYAGKLYDRPALDAMLAKAEALAARPLIGDVLYQAIQAHGIDAAVKQYRGLRRSQAAAYDFSEDEFITLGYRLLRAKQTKDSIAIFQLGVEAYPASDNAWESLGEACMDDGQKELARQSFQKALALNPRNTYAADLLGKLK